MIKLEIPAVRWPFGRTAPDATVPPFKTCAGCGRAGRPDQSVPEPGQFAKIIGTASVVPAKAPDPIEINWAAFNTDPGAAAGRLSDEQAKREKDGTAVKLIDAAPVRCSCGRWYHAIGCYSLHRAGDPARAAVHDCNTHD